MEPLSNYVLEKSFCFVEIVICLILFRIVISQALHDDTVPFQWVAKRDIYGKFFRFFGGFKHSFILLYLFKVEQKVQI